MLLSRSFSLPFRRCPVRRCLHTLLIALLTLALSMDAARACWFLRARRQCRPRAVAVHCPPAVWSGCGEVVVVREWVGTAAEWPAQASDPAPACCCGGASQPPAAVSETAVAEDAVGGETRSVVQEQATEASGGAAPAAGAGPLPEIPAARTEDAVTPASNDELVPDLEPVQPIPPAEVPAEDPLAADPEMREEEEDFDPEPPLPAAADDLADEPEEMIEDEPPLPGFADEEPPPEEDADPAPAVEPAPAPPPADPNLFDDFDDAETAAEPTGPAVRGFGAAPAAEPSPLDALFADADEEAAAADEEMVEDEEAPTSDPVTDAFDEPALPGGADPFADDPVSPPADDEVPPDEDQPPPAPDIDPASAADPAPGEDAAAAAEPVRRWVHASGTAILVARLVDVAGDGTCLLETEGRRIRVPLENLSGHDREYASGAGVRLAALREHRERAAKAAAASAPRATDTAGR